MGGVAPMGAVSGSALLEIPVVCTSCPGMNGLACVVSSDEGVDFAFLGGLDLEDVLSCPVPFIHGGGAWPRGAPV